MRYRSNIRTSEINELIRKVQEKRYGKYLYKVSLTKVRGFENQVVTFDFPVTALIGPNGGGKTTILGAVACAYKSIRPRFFFARSGRLDETMQDWKIEYEVIDKRLNPRDTVKRSARFHRSRWTRDAFTRSTAVFGVSRTVPAIERTEMKMCATNGFEVEPANEEPISSLVSEHVQRILGKDISSYSHIRVDNRGRVSLLTGVTKDGSKYSEFHFGAGESSVIRMVMAIEALEENSLVLIEEIENGLHPIATVKMVEYLINVARRKSVQAIFTTHSNDALMPLPNSAIWSALEGTVSQGKLKIESLRAIQHELDARLVAFVEDEFAAEWVKAMLRSHGGIAVDLVEVHPMAGDGTAVKVNVTHNIDPSRTCESVCFIDGDSEQIENLDNRVYRLPGQKPEAYIYDSVLEKLSEVKGKLAVALHHHFQNQEEVATLLEKVRVENLDPHIIFSQAGEQLGLLSEEVVRGAFLSIWTETHADEVRRLIDPILDLVNQYVG